MDIGIVVLPTDRSAPLGALAAAAEERGLSSVYVGGDHTHIPVSRETPFPGGGELPDDYRRTFEPLIALAAAAAVTSTIRLGTCIYLLAQRDTIVAAKQLASLDHLSGGRLVAGVGYGWNIEEARHHDVTWSSRRTKVREQVQAMRALWTEEEATAAGLHASFAPSWMWPKPAGHVPVVLGASPGPRTFADIVDWADGWFPVPFWGHGPADAVALRQLASDRGRDPAELAVIVDGVLPDPAQLDPWAEVQAEEALVAIPSEDLDAVLPALDAAAALIDRYR